jgi:poly-gamma-glutamate synthesis protein (capsule biosynthesis protein)
MEVYLVDRRTWPHGFGNNWAPKEMAQDFAAMGFDMLVSGEGAGGVEGMRSSIRWLDEVGIPLAGYGPNLTIARQPVLQQTPKGRVALVAAYPVPDRGAGSGSDVARGLVGDTGWGLNPLRMNVWHVVTQDQMDQLKGIRDAIVARRNEADVSRPIAVPEDRPDRVTLFADNNYMVGPETGEYHYELNPADRRAQILAVRNAKEYADFAMFSMHVHQNRYAFQAYSQDHYPTQYLIDLTHDMVDNGMDMYIGHGNHTMQGIEIYNGRPIFYNLGNFSVHRFGADYSGDAGPMTSIERAELADQWLQQAPNQRAFVAKVMYQDGILEELRIYPVDLGGAQGPNRRTWSRTDVPMTPEPELAREILGEVQEYSRPFGTEIAIEVDELSRVVGVIRVSPSATVPVGEGLRETLGN